MTHSTHFKRIYDVEHMVKIHSDNERGNLLSTLHGLLFPISNMGSIIHHPTERIVHKAFNHGAIGSRIGPSWCTHSSFSGYNQCGARCSSVVRAFDHGAMSRRIDPSWWTHEAISRSSQCSMCYAVCGMVHIKEPLLLFGNSNLCGGSCFPLSLSEWCFTMCVTPYNRK